MTVIDIPSNPMEDETVLPIAMEDFSKEPDFPYLLSRLLHVSYLIWINWYMFTTKRNCSSNPPGSIQKNFFYEGKAGMDKCTGVSDP